MYEFLCFCSDTISNRRTTVKRRWIKINTFNTFIFDRNQNKQRVNVNHIHNGIYYSKLFDTSQNSMDTCACYEKKKICTISAAHWTCAVCGSHHSSGIIFIINNTCGQFNIQWLWVLFHVVHIKICVLYRIHVHFHTTQISALQQNILTKAAIRNNHNK